jgi:hypothetical protein
MSWKIRKLGVKGVKGVLDRSGDFDLGDGKSIAVYAPNGCGKSGYADAVEYLYSKDGAVEHLGQGGADSERGGKHAIPHVLADEKGITPLVSVTLHNDSPPETIEVTRQVKTGRADPMPAQLEAIVKAAPAHRILRQHDLRRFIVEMQPREKYSELSRWLGLEHLEEVLAHLTTTRNELAKADPDREFSERLQDIVKHTNSEVTKYDVPMILAWCNKKTKEHLGGEQTIATLSDLDRVVGMFRMRRNELVLQVGAISERHQAKQQLEQSSQQLVVQDGRIKDCAKALTTAVGAERKSAEMVASAKESFFQQLWEASKQVLDTKQTTECPVCLTEWDNTKAGSQRAALLHVTQGLERLDEVKKAQADEKNSATQLRDAAKAVQSTLEQLQEAARKLSLSEIVDQSSALSAKLAEVPKESQPISGQEALISELLSQCRNLVEKKVNASLPKVQIENLPPEATSLEDTIGQFLGLKTALQRLDELMRERDEYQKMAQNFEAIATLIQSRASNLIDGVVQSLRSDVERIYRKIHPASVIPHIHITPDTKNKTLGLRVDFHSPSRTVPPGGYLSESQINTLGVALFVSCVRTFNRSFPFVFLDDIVSSYDADHRARIVDVVAEELVDFQVFLTTHDERFYAMLKSRLASKGWQFDRVTGWVFEEGPRRETDSTEPDVINRLIQAGDPFTAGNAVRRYMEEWLDEMCAEYEVYTVHKRGPKEYYRTLFDYWDPFVTRLKNIKGSFFAQRIEKQECYDRLKSHPLINYYSHAQANPYGWSSMGDVSYVWDEFTKFQGLFHCHGCARLLKYDHDGERLYCTCGGQIFPPAT